MGIFTNDSTPQQPRRVRRAAVRAQRALLPSTSSSPFASLGQRAQAVSYNYPRPMTAAASQMKLTDVTELDLFKKRKISADILWQHDAFEYFDAIGEINYALNMMASVTSRIRLFAGIIDNPAEAPAPVDQSPTISSQTADAAQRALSRLSSAFGGQSGLIKDASLNLNIAGECYLVQIPARPGSGLPESWDIRSIDELQVDSKGNYRIITSRDFMGKTGAGTILLPQDAFVARIWSPHPRFSAQPTSSMKPLLDLCSELLLVNRAFRGMEKSRLNAGAMYIPDGLSVAADPDPDMPYDNEGVPNGPTPEEQADDFEEQLLEAMSTPISDESAANSIVPLIIRGPADLGGQIKQFKFERTFDKTMEARGDKLVSRILSGLDVPKDIVTGLASVRYTNAQTIDDSLYKAHIEPLMLLLCDSLTQVYLRPYLLSIGYPEIDVNRLVIWYDPSDISTKTDRVAAADSGFEKGAISMQAWREANGFGDTDAPTPTEFALRFLNDKGMISPELTETLLQTLAPDVMNAAKSTQQASSVAPLPGAVSTAIGVAPTAGAPTAAPGAAPTPPAPVGSNANDGLQPTPPPAEPVDTSTPADGQSAAPVEAGEDAPAVPLSSLGKKKADPTNGEGSANPNGS